MHDVEYGEWPEPRYSAGSSKHLHALGVIAVTFSQLERSIDDLYIYAVAKTNVPMSLIRTYYFSLPEDRRSGAVLTFFKDHEQDAEVIELIANLLKGLAWCRISRNQLMHSAQYPTGLGANHNFYYFIKKIDRKSASSGYLRLSLAEIRQIADKIRDFVERSAEISIYLRIRGRSKESIEKIYWPFLWDALPEPIAIPPAVELSPQPVS